MREDDRVDDDNSLAERMDAPLWDRFNHDIFGDFSVVGPGVHIVLDGRPISNPNV